jgi:hypothetical protein
MKLSDLVARLLPHKPLVRVALVVFVVAFLFFQCARAASPHTRIDVGARIAKGETPYLLVSAVYPGPGDNLTWQGGLGLLGSSNDDEYGYTRNNGFLYGMLVAERYRVSLGLGVAQLFEPTPYSGSRTQFALMLRYRLLTHGRGRCDIQHFHLSNAGIAPPNPGLELPGVGCSLQW